MSDSGSSAAMRGRVQWGHFGFLIGILAFLGFYLWDAWRAQATIDNLIFLLPVTIFCGLTVLAIAVGLLREQRHTADSDDASSSNRILPLALSVACFAAYVFLLPIIGFDVGTFLFIAIVLVILGERRPLFIVLYAAVFSALTVFGFKAMIPTPFPTLLL